MDTLLKLMLVFAGMLGLTIAIVIYMVVNDYGSESVVLDEEPHEPVLLCDASTLEGAICPSGYYCQFNTCVPVEPEPTCGEGENCRECECSEGLRCHQYRCTATKYIDWVPPECEKDTRLADAVRVLADRCSKRKQNVDDMVSCTPAEWSELALEDGEFDLLLSAFPNRFAIHFPPGRPFLKGDAWPTADVRSHLRRRVSEFREPLRAAKQIFVIGRASPDGSAKTNHYLAIRRMNLVDSLIEEVIHEEMTQTEQDQQRIRIRPFTLPTDRAINPRSYIKNYLRDPGGAERIGVEPLVTWDDESLAWLKAQLADPNVVDAENTPAWQMLHSAVNRMVLVIPIPCTGNEVPRETGVLPQADKRVSG